MTKHVAETDPLHSGLKLAVDALGSASAVARVIGVTPQAVSELMRRSRRMPAEWCIPLERAIAMLVMDAGSGRLVTKEQMRPDIYPPQRDAA